MAQNDRLWIYSYSNLCSPSLTMLAIRLPADLEDRLAALAERTGRTKTFYAREAIEKHIDDLEDLYLAEKELAKVQSGRSKPVPLAEVMKAHGLGG